MTKKKPVRKKTVKVTGGNPSPLSQLFQGGLLSMLMPPPSPKKKTIKYKR